MPNAVQAIKDMAIIDNFTKLKKIIRLNLFLAFYAKFVLYSHHKDINNK